MTIFSGNHSESVVYLVAELYKASDHLVWRGNFLLAILPYKTPTIDLKSIATRTLMTHLHYDALIRNKIPPKFQAQVPKRKKYYCNQALPVYYSINTSNKRKIKALHKMLVYPTIKNIVSQLKLGITWIPNLLPVLQELWWQEQVYMRWTSNSWPEHKFVMVQNQLEAMVTDLLQKAVNYCSIEME